MEITHANQSINGPSSSMLLHTLHTYIAKQPLTGSIAVTHSNSTAQQQHARVCRWISQFTNKEKLSYLFFFFGLGYPNNFWPRSFCLLASLVSRLLANWCRESRLREATFLGRVVPIGSMDGGKKTLALPWLVSLVG